MAKVNERRSVLVVDDDPGVIKMLRHNLEKSDLRIIEAANGLEGIGALLKEKIALVLTDIDLPDFSGWGILCILRLTRTLSHIPILVISGEPPDRALLNQFKPDEYIQKPFDMRYLLTLVERAIRSERVPVKAK